MKLNFRDLLHTKTSFSTFKKQDLFVNQTREWTYALFFATVFFLGSVLFIGFSFYMQMYAPSESVETSAKMLEYKEKDVLFYSEKYNVKENTFNSLLKKHQKTVLPVVNPVVGNEVATTTVESSVVPPLADIQLGQ